MPRPISWLPRLHEIRRSVGSSVRSHYDRSDLQVLFELQPRAAQKLLKLLPTVAIGTSRLVEREALANFLDGVHGADDVGSFLEQVQQQKAGTSRRKIRSLVRRALEPATLTSLPEGMSLARGRIEISFRSVEHLAETMYALARILESQGEEFAQHYEPLPPEAVRENADEIRAMFTELEHMEAIGQP